MADLNLNFNQNLDAFARLRVSNPQTLFDSKQIADKQPLFWDDQQTSGSGTTSTYNTNQSSTTLAVGASTAGKRVRQTYASFNYQSGKSQLIVMTGIIGAPATGITRRLGQLNDNNGYFFISSPTAVGVGIRTYTSGAAVDNVIAQANWNLDRLDGTGASGLTLDPTRVQVFFFDYQWLGVGAVRFGFSIDGDPVYVHQFNHANVNSLVYTSTPNLPLRYEIENSGAGGAANMLHICASVITEGGRGQTGVVRGLNRTTNTLVTLNNDSIYPLIGIRLKAANLGAFLEYISHSIICTSVAESAWYLLLRPTVVGTTPTWIPETDSSVEYCFPTNATTLTGGYILNTGISSESNNIRVTSSGFTTDILTGANIAGTRDEIYLATQRLTGTTETFYSAMNYRESF